jgi:TetR/AcrR family transcriptional repressor of nem operon
MARYDQQHKDATRARILQTSGRRLKTDGIDGSGVATLMKDAGLTNGAFYAHFSSKDDLVSEVVRAELSGQLAATTALPAGAAGVDALVGSYLSIEHRDHPADGCPSAALLDEVARSGEGTRAAYTEVLLEIVDEIAGRLRDVESADEGGVDVRERARVLSAYALMSGTIQLARVLTDDALSREVVEEGARQVRTMLGLT